ncbi:MAG: hypothetical protein H5T84_06135, partial [Thermoleophilia bacterium]|nr:hypothetical protein [Thermoleophilia bacterium]
MTVVLLAVTTGGGSTAQLSSGTLLVSESRGPAAPVAAGGEDHPAFARLDTRNLLLPVAAGDATIVAYQPIDDERAVALTPIGSQANANPVVRLFRRIFAGEPSLRYYVLESGKGVPTSSVDIGALPGTPVCAPVSGIVTGVRQYKLYGKYDDVQI